MTKPNLRGGVREVVLPAIREYQRDMYESPARFKLNMSGRRWGKNKVALVAAIDGHGPRQGHWRQWRGALQGARIGWVVPSDKSQAALEIWKDLKASAGGAAVTTSEELKLLTLPGGGSIQVLSGYAPEALRSFFLDGVVVDECSLQDPKVWKVLRPVLSDYGGWGILLGNVPEDVTGHWFVQLHHLANTPPMRSRGWQTWRRPSWDNPQMTAADLDEARETLGTRVFLREYGAELVGIEGGVWQEAWFEGHFYRELPERETWRRWVLTVDAAWKTGVRNDYTSGQMWMKTLTDYYLVDELHGRWESPELRRRVSVFRAQWAPVAHEAGIELPVYVEAVGGGQVAVQEFRAACDYPVLEYSVRGSTKMARNEAVSPLAESGKVWLPEAGRAPWVRQWVTELIGFPDLPHDDRCDAASMALQILQGWGEAARAILRPEAVVAWERGGYA